MAGRAMGISVRSYRLGATKFNIDSYAVSVSVA